MTARHDERNDERSPSNPADRRDITLVVPLYNGRKYLDALLSTIRPQQNRFHSIIFIDDGSIDGSIELVEAFGLENVRFSRNERNMGLYDTLNRALTMVDSEYVALIFQDDLLETDFAEEMQHLIERWPETSFFTAGSACIDERGAVLRSHTPDRNDRATPAGKSASQRVLLHGTSWIISGSVSRVSALRRLGFRGDMPQCGDFELFARASREEAFVYYDRILTRIREHEQQASVQNVAMSADLKERIKTISEHRKLWGNEFSLSFRAELSSLYLYYIVRRAGGQFWRGSIATGAGTLALVSRLAGAVWGHTANP